MSAAEILSVLEWQESILDRLLALSARQRASIEDSRVDLLRSIVTARRGLVEELAHAQSRAAQLDRSGVGGDHRIEAISASIRTKLNEMIRRDGEDSARIEEARGGIRRELEGTARARRAAVAYLAGPAPAPRHEDRKG